MIAALAAAPTATDAITLPLVFTVAIATLALVAIAVFVRRTRRAGQLTGVTAAASGVSAVGVLVSAFVLSVALGGTAVASAQDAPSISPASVISPPSGVSTGSLDGFQLPTE